MARDRSVSERVGVLGGSFDPPHIGHVVLAHEVLWRLRLDRVCLVPCRQSPHKESGHRFGAEVRAEMAEAAVADRPGLSVSRIELERPAPSYTVDTLEALGDLWPDAELWLILGSDQLESFARWRDPERILSVARIAAVDRGEDPRIPPEVDADRVDRVSMPRIDISSSEIRRRIDGGEPIDHLLPGGVAQIIIAA